MIWQFPILNFALQQQKDKKGQQGQGQGQQEIKSTN